MFDWMLVRMFSLELWWYRRRFGDFQEMTVLILCSAKNITLKEAVLIAIESER